MAKYPKKSVVDKINIMPKSIAVMLSLDYSGYNVSDEQAKKFINSIDLIRNIVKADVAYVSIATEYVVVPAIEQTLKILKKHLKKNIKIGINFINEGLYDFQTKKITYENFYDRIEKIPRFLSHYLNNYYFDNQWFAIIDDYAITKDDYKIVQKIQPALFLAPSQNNIDNSNFMYLVTTTKGFAGINELLDKYTLSIKDMTYSDILATQKKILTKLTGAEIISKIINKDFAYLEKYFLENYASDDDYLLMTKQLKNIPLTILNKQQLNSLKNIIELLLEYNLKNNNLEQTDAIKLIKKQIATSN